MGLFSKKSKTKSSGTVNQNTTMSQTPVNPQWVTDSVMGLNDKINTTFGGLDPTKMVAGPNPLQQQAATSAGSLGTPSQFGEGSSMLRAGGNAGPSRVTAASSLDGLSKFMNPFLKDVVDTSMADYDFGAGMTRAADQLAKAGDATFGGSGGAIQTALSNDALTRGRGSLSAGLRSDAFNTALGASEADANRRQSADIATGQFSENALQRQINAGNSIANIGGMEADNTRANIGTKAAVGGNLRDIQNEQNNAPINLLMQQIAAQTGLPLELFKGLMGSESMSGTQTGKSTTKTGGSLSWSPTGGLKFG